MKALSLFSGAGGMDIGIRQAGFNILAEIENDEHCCSTLRAASERNNLSTRILQADIRSIEPGVLLTELGIKEGELDLMFGGPPCQSFSLAGKQLGLLDDRGLLLFEVIRFAMAMKPSIILIEQVKGLLSSKDVHGNKGEVFDKFIRELKNIDYIPKWRVINAADFGVPQLRERLFIVATREKNGFLFPEASHTSSKNCGGLFYIEPYQSVGQAINGLGIPERKIRGKTVYEREDSHVDVTPDRDIERIAQVPEGSYLAAQTHLCGELRMGLSSKDTTKYLRLHRNRPSNTLRCGEIFYHPTENRYLTPREYMRIHGYPDDYYLKGPIRSRTGTVRNLDQHRQVANSVPPPLAKILGLQIARYIGE